MRPVGGRTRWADLSVRRKALVAFLLFGSLWLAAQSVLFSLGSFFERSNPVLAMRIVDSPASELRVALLDASQQTPPSLVSPEVETAAYRVLMKHPADVLALRSLSYVADDKGETRKSLRLAQLANRLNRRDEMTQLMLAQHMANADRNEEALGHFDRAVRTTSSGREQLYALIFETVETADLPLALEPLVSDETPWMADYMLYVARNFPSGAEHAAGLLRKARAVETDRLLDEVDQDILTLLSVRNNWDELERFYDWVRPSHSDPARDPRLMPATISPDLGPFAWSGLQGTTVGGSLSPDHEDGARAEVYGMRNGRDIALRRYLLLPSGFYRLFEERTLLLGGEQAEATWLLRCPTMHGSPIIWTGPEDELAYNVSGASGPTIPPECAVQQLELRVAGGRNLSGVELSIDAFDLRR